MRVTFNLNPSAKSKAEKRQPIEWSPPKEKQEPKRLTQIRVERPTQTKKRFAIGAADLLPKEQVEAEPRPKPIPEIIEPEVNAPPAHSKQRPNSIPETIEPEADDFSTRSKHRPKSIPETVEVGQNELCSTNKKETSALVLQENRLPTPSTEDKQHRGGILQALSELLTRFRFLLDHLKSRVN